MSNKSYQLNPIYDIRNLTTEQLCDKYGISVCQTTGTVWDPVEEKEFESVLDWANFYIEVNSGLADSVKITKRHDWDDDYY